MRLLERSGEIADLREQVSFELIPKQSGRVLPVRYVADFVYRTKTGETVVEDAKGVRTEVYKIKAKLMRWVHGIVISEV